MKINDVVLAMVEKEHICVPYSDFAKLVNIANKHEPSVSILAMIHSEPILQDERAILEYVHNDQSAKNRIIEELSEKLDTDISKMIEVITQKNVDDINIAAPDRDAAQYTIAHFMNDEKVNKL